MAGRIAENIIEDILSRVDIAELISGYIPLKRAGRNFRALCPFHHEKTPSFMVSPDRQIYHCFGGCGAGGNAISFLMQYERLEFPEAVEILAKKAGVILPDTQKQDTKSASLVTNLYKINEAAASFYGSILNSSASITAKNYLLKRGVKEESISLFKLGFAPDKWDALINHLRGKSISLSLLEKAGLALAREGGGYYDRFRNRIIFPIFDIKSRPLAFGARLLEKEANSAKYVNSPETDIYVKGRNLYGLNFAKDDIRQNDYVIIVEGYLDFILPYQEGVKNIVASLGTALTQEQARLIKRYTHNVVMVYDGDTAGEIATLRTLDIFIEEGMDVKVASLPEGFDPDLFVRKNGIESFKAKIADAEELFEYKLRILKSRHSIKEVQGKAKIASLMLPTINRFKNAIIKSEYIKKLAAELDTAEDNLLQELGKLKEDKPYPVNQVSADRKSSSVNPTEKLLIKLMLEETALIDQLRNTLEPGDFQDERTAKIVSTMFDLFDQGKPIKPKSLINHFGDGFEAQLVCESTLSPEVPSQDREKIIEDCVRRIKNETKRLRKQYLHKEIKIAQDSGDEEKLSRLMQEFSRLTKVR